ncbi:flap endonuclease 1, partial [Reticulomyxa filosa]
NIKKENEMVDYTNDLEQQEPIKYDNEKNGNENGLVDEYYGEKNRTWENNESGDMTHDDKEEKEATKTPLMSKNKDDEIVGMESIDKNNVRINKEVESDVDGAVMMSWLPQVLEMIPIEDQAPLLKSDAEYVAAINQKYHTQLNTIFAHQPELSLRFVLGYAHEK